jgi:lipopolysaccharide heptosyltransferase II
MSSDAWRNHKNILCIRLDNMGDVLMSQPAMRALKQPGLDRQITLLTSSIGAAIAPFIREVDAVIPFDVPWVKTDEAKGEQQLLALSDELRSRRFDAAVIFASYSQNPLPAAMLCYQAGIKAVLGYCRENPYQLITDWVPDREPLDYIVHEVQRQLRLVETVGAVSADTDLSLRVPEESRQTIRARLAAFRIGRGRPWLVLHAGVSEEKRRYPADKYISACRSLIGQGYKIVLTGSSSEQGYVSDITRRLGEGAANLAGDLSIAELIALIAAAPVVISNNTGPVHIAAAVGTPVVVLYAMTNPQHTPWKVSSRVLYFAVRPELKTKNRLLQTFPGIPRPKASPLAITAAVNELARDKLCEIELPY